VLQLNFFPTDYCFFSVLPMPPLAGAAGGVAGVAGTVALPDVLPDAPPLVLPLAEPLAPAPAPALLSLMHFSCSAPMRPTHLLGTSVLPDAPADAEPEALVSAEPDDCAMAMLDRAKSVATVSVFNIMCKSPRGG
jgi:hypothetical protein